MPNKDSYQLQLRNQAIRQSFYFYLRSGLSRMLAYAKTASDYFLSEAQVRDIVAKKRTL